MGRHLLDDVLHRARPGDGRLLGVLLRFRVLLQPLANGEGRRQSMGVGLVGCRRRMVHAGVGGVVYASTFPSIEHSNGIEDRLMERRLVEMESPIVIIWLR